MKHNRRDFIKTTALATAAGIVMTKTGNVFSAPHGDTFKLQPLPYDAAALEPHIDAQTMTIHHDRHHAAYVTKLNEAIAPMHLHDISIEKLCGSISKYDAAVRNNAGGHYNHTAFWQMMKPKADGKPSGRIEEALTGSFGTVDKFKEQFAEAAMKRFGSGWAWLVKGADNKLAIGSTPNQDNPLMDVSEFKGKLLLALDVWEHAFIKDYAPAERPKYIEAFFANINWSEVNSRLG